MIELCTKKRMLLGIVALGGLSVLIIILESRHLHTPDEDVHDYHPVLKERLSSDDKCWKTEEAVIVQECDLCTAEEIVNENPIVCVAKGYKELVECKKSQRKTYRSCDRVGWIEEKHFWTFECALTLLGILSGLSLYIRQKQIDHRMYQRIQKQIAAGV